MQGHRRPATLIAFTLSLLAGPGSARAGESYADPYDDALAQAAALEQAGKLAEAARLLEAVSAYYPQDYAIALQIGWIHYRAGHFAEAARAYGVALSRSPGALDARLGFGLSLERLGRCDEALAYLRSAAAERPDLSAPREAIERCAPRSTWSLDPSVSLSGTYYPDHPWKALSGGVTAGLGIKQANGWFLGGTYRYSRIVPPSTASVSAWDQHEGYFTAGYSTRGWGLGLTYGLVHDGSGTFGTSHHAGFSLRWSPFGDLVLDGSASFYDDLTVLRAAPSWKIPIAHGFSVRPGAAVQWAGGEVLGTATLTLSLEGAPGGLFAGGKYGDEVRPAYLSIPLVYNISERIPYGLWVGGSVNVGEALRIHVTYSMDRLKRPDGSSFVESFAHSLTIGTNLSF